MMNRERSLARNTGGVVCPCCRCAMPNRTARTREKRTWRKDVDNARNDS